MTEDHTFIDSGGSMWSGRRECLAAWSGFFVAYPDYRNVFTAVEIRGDMAVITGRSVCDEPALNGPAIWTAKVVEGQIAEWRVYDDTTENRVELELS
jgi:ketosteroid isomerase-like protein